MRGSSRCVVLFVGLMSLLVALTGPAGASTWHNSGGSAFTATSGPSTFVASGNSVACAADYTTGTAPALSSPGPVWTSVVMGSTTFTPCRLAGIGWHVYCPSFQFDAVTYTLGTDSVAGNISFGSGCLAGPGATDGINDLCRLTLTSGRTTGTYANRVATLTVGASALTIANNGASTCPSSLGTGSGTMSSSQEVVTSANPPNIRQP